MANLRRHPARYITMDQAFECTLHIPLREELAKIFIDHYDRAVQNYGADAHKTILYEMQVVDLIRRLHP